MEKGLGIDMSGSPRSPRASASHVRPWLVKRLGYAAALALVVILINEALAVDQPHSLKLPRLPKMSRPQLFSSKAESEALEQVRAPPRRPAAILNERPPNRIGFREHLLPQIRYITAPLANDAQWREGFTYQTHSLTNLLYLAQLTKRIPIVPPFLPNNDRDKDLDRPPNAQPLPVGAVFDLERFTDETGVPLIQWADIKSNKTDESLAEEIGCWSVAQATSAPHDQQALGLYNVNVTSWPMPAYITGTEGQWEIAFPALQAWDIAATARQEWIEDLKGSTAEERASLRISDVDWETAVEPDASQVLCFDSVYLVESAHSDGFGFPEGKFPSDRQSFEFAGANLHFQPALVAAADAVLERLLGSAATPFIGIHIRRKDYQQRELQQYSEALERLYWMVQPNGMASRENLRMPIIALTDETDTQFHDSIAHQGWLQVDHQVVQGPPGFDRDWLPIVLDAIILSKARGIVGTSGSTFSYMAMLRQTAWQEDGKAVFAG